MDEMLALAPEQARQYDEFTWGDDLSQKRVTRHMVSVLASEMTWKGRENSQSLRGVWYSGVKQIYQSLFPEKWDPGHYSESPSRRFSQVLSEVVSEMVKDGKLSYRDLNVVDDSRDREIMGTDDIEHDKILFVEKRAKYRQLKPIADVLEVSLVSGGGWQATALIEDLANVLDATETYQIFVLTDYDPTGYRIAEDFESRAETLGINVESVDRIGIEPRQVNERTAQNERFEVPVENDYDEAWLARHGMEDQYGQPRYGLELEAIGGRDSAAADFRTVVVDALEPHLRKERHRQRGLNIRTASTARAAVDRIIDDLTARLEGELLDAAVEDLKQHPAVDRLYHTDGSVRAALDVQTREDNDDDDRVPRPLPWADYTEAAIDPPQGADDPRPKPSNRRQVLALEDRLREQIADGEIDIEDLLDL